jgi:hypothetical protein
MLICLPATVQQFKPVENGQINDILCAARNAGREFIETGAIPAALQDAVGREIVSRAAYMELINKKAELYARL